MDSSHERNNAQNNAMAPTKEFYLTADSRTSTGSTIPNKPQRPTQGPIYHNSLLLAVGLLDLTNALDFPANVWNQRPPPLYAQILMGLGGSIALLAISIAVWDMVRCSRNIAFLRRERIGLLGSKQGLIEKAWLRINTRELCWEIIDRFLLDFFMALTAVFVGSGTLMALRYQDDRIFNLSNILSGYLGNSFLAFYALLNVVWSGIMFHRAHANQAAVKRSNLDPELAGLMKWHAWKHQLYAAVNGTTLVVSGVASMVSATMWQGYVVQVPCVVCSLFVVCFWRFGLGYDRLSFPARSRAGEMDLLERVRAVVGVRAALERKQEGDLVQIVSGSGESGLRRVMDFLQDVARRGELETKLAATPEPGDQEKASTTSISQEVTRCIETAGVRRFRYEERFLLELYGYYLREEEVAQARTKV